MTTIGDSAFRGCSSLTSIDIPDSVTEIGRSAFKNCSSLTSIDIPDGVTEIGECAFEGCSSLTSIVIPNKVTILRNKLFSQCVRLSSVNIPDGVTRIEKAAFESCHALKSIRIPDSVRTIAGGFNEGAFFDAGLTSVTLSNGVKTIENYVFADCKDLTVVHIPEGVKKIKTDAFEHRLKYTIVCREGSYAHRYSVKKHISYIFDYQYEAYHGVLPPGIEKLQSPFLADEEKPYIFISYSHKDRDRVLPILKTLYESGWKIWYDEGLTIGDRYDETLEEHVRNCAAFLLFVTECSVNSSYIRNNEIPWAEKYEKQVIKCILDEGTDIAVKEESVAAIVGRGDIEPALKKIKELTQGERREAKGVSVIVDPANRSNAANGNSFAYCLYAKESAATAKAILLEAKNSGCKLYDSVESGEDDEKLQSAACLIVFLDKAFLSDKSLTKLLTEAYQAGRDIVVCRLEDVDAGDYPQELSELDKMHALNFVYGITPDMNKHLARHLQERGCRNTAVLPGLKYKVSFNRIIIQRYTGAEKEPRLESEYGGVPVERIDRRAFQNCIHLEKLVIPDGIKEIGDNAFEGCISLTSIDIPDSVTTIRWSAFSGCTSLTSITIPDSVTEIGECAFWGCTSLTSIVIPDSVKKIGYGIFNGCSSLTSVVIPNKVTEIAAIVFSGCSSLTSIVIPDSVTRIGWGAFENCSSLTSIVNHDSVTIIEQRAFAGYSSLTPNVTPDSAAKIEQSAFEGYSSLTPNLIPDSVTTIGDSAFAGCKSLTSIVIPDSVTTIGERAFAGCKSLTSIVIPKSVTKIAENAFSNCDHLTVICSPGSYARRYCKRNDIPFKAPD